MRIQSFYLRTLFCTVFLAIFLSACGKQVNDPSEELQIRLELPAGEMPEIFWYGVDRRELEISRSGETIGMWDWKEQGRIEVETEAGDRLGFRGFDHSGRVLVEGSATVDEEKKISIPLRRVL